MNENTRLHCQFIPQLEHSECPELQLAIQVEKGQECVCVCVLLLEYNLFPALETLQGIITSHNVRKCRILCLAEKMYNTRGRLRPGLQNKIRLV